LLTHICHNQIIYYLHSNKRLYNSIAICLLKSDILQRANTQKSSNTIIIRCLKALANKTTAYKFNNKKRHSRIMFDYAFYFLAHFTLQA